MSEINDFSLQALISESPTAFHAAQYLTDIATKLGCRPTNFNESLSSAPGAYVTTSGGAIIAWMIPETATHADRVRFNVIAGHTDSPTLKLKPHPDHAGVSGFNQLAVEIYGGMLPNSWLDRDLGIAGQIVDKDGNVQLVRIDDICRVAQLAVHLDRDSAQELKLNRQTAMRPIWGIGRKESILDVIAQISGLESGAEIIAHDLQLFDSAGPRNIGLDGEFLVGGRQDNLASMYSMMKAFAQLLDSESTAVQGNTVTIPVLMGFDHEEIGSESATGAAGPILVSMLRRIAAALNVAGADFDQALTNSICLSCDVAHSIHPNYSDKHDVDNYPVLGGGPVIKRNANQRYATESIGEAAFIRACRKAGVPIQVFASNNTVPCGSTIGPITATRLGIRTVDIGTPILSMHSIREMSLLSDHEAMATAMLQWWLDA